MLTKRVERFPARVKQFEVAWEPSALGGFTISLPDGRRCRDLSWDEMLGTVAELTHPQIDRNRYAFQTDWEYERRWNRLSRAPLLLTHEINGLPRDVEPQCPLS